MKMEPLKMTEKGVGVGGGDAPKRDSKYRGNTDSKCPERAGKSRR